MKMSLVHKQQGITLVEILVTVALMGLFFTGLFAGLQLMVKIVSNSQAEAGALATAIERLEYIHSLDYFEAGTIGGVVNGPIPQTATSTLNGITYTETVSIQYFDREDDGLVTDTVPDPIPQDSKRVELSVSWDDRGTTRSIDMQTDLIPPGLESIDGGGTIVVNVFDAEVLPIAGVFVTIYNDTFSPAISDVYYTDSNGRAVIPGVPSGSEYQLTATLPGYSVDQTYVSSSTNPVPIRLPISVATGTVSTLNFQIDQLSDLTVETIGTPVKSIFTDTFASSTLIASSTDTEVSGGAVVLLGGPSSYAATGTVFSDTPAPTTLDGWESFDFNGTTSADTNILVQVYSASGTGSTTVFTLIPDVDFSGNSTGFTSGPVNITSISTSTYPRIALAATLTSSDSNTTPELYDWSITHIESELSIGSIPFSLTGAKTIGTNGSSPVYKYQDTHTTDGAGSVLIPDLEFDGYSFSLLTGSYNISEIIGGDPYEKQPGVDETVTLVLNSSVVYSLRATINDIYNNPIGGASVNLYDGGSYDVTQDTSIYGQTFFDSGLASSTYTLDVDASGYDSLSQAIVIDGNVETVLQLVETGSGGGGGSSSTPSTYLAGYNTRIPLSIDGGSLFGAVSDYPVYVDLSDLPSSFFSSVQASGADIRMTDEDGQTEIPFELVVIDTGAETGQLHFKATDLSIGTSTNFYMYYGSTTASAYADSDLYGADNVWTNNYLAVYHLEEDSSGTGNANLYQDSTSNEYHADDYVSDTDKDGQISLGQDMTPSGDYVSVPSAVLDGQSDVTTSFWYRSNSDSIQSILSGANGSQANEYMVWFRDRNDIEFFSHGSRVYHDLTFSMNDGVWRHYTSVRDDANNRSRIYINGSEISDSPLSMTMSTLSISSGGIIIGQDQDSVGGGFQSSQDSDGPLDEFRVSSVVRSDAWIANEYLNLNSPSSFYSVGTEETE